MVSLLLAAAILQFQYPGAEVSRLDQEVFSLGWTREGRLIAVTDRAVVEPLAKRSAPLRYSKVRGFDFDDRYRFRGGSPLRFSSDGKRAIGWGFVLDVRTLQTKPLKRDAIWVGNALAEIDDDDPWRYTLLRGSKRTQIGRGWYVLGISDDARYAMACREVPFGDVSTSLLSVDSTTGKVKVLRRYPKSSNDHVEISEVARQPGGFRFLVHSIDVASGICGASWASSKLMPIEFEVPLEVSNWNGIAWLDKNWLVAHRHFFGENEKGGFDADAVDLWRPSTNRLVRLVKVTNPWPAKDTSDLRGSGPKLSCSAVDSARSKLAYAVVAAGKSRIYVLDFKERIR